MIYRISELAENLMLPGRSGEEIIAELKKIF
jgi:hypothetical protein